MARPQRLANIQGDRISSPITVTEDGGLFVLEQDGEMVECTGRQLDELTAALNALHKSRAGEARDV